jgi:hypothetical protein
MSHWYDKNGNPCYEVPNKSKGGMRPTTLRDAKKLGLYPSVTTVQGIVDKPALVRWFKEQTALAAWEIQKFEPKEAWVAEVIAKSTEVSDTAADIGSEIHDALEKSHLGEEYPDDYKDIVERVEAEVKRVFGARKWIAEKSFASPLGYGGKVDLHAPGIVLDYKTKDTLFDKNGKLKKLAWPNHCQQLAAYGHGLGLTPGFVAANVFVSYTGDVHIHTWSQKEIDHEWKVFLATLNLWQLANKYIPEAAAA